MAASEQPIRIALLWHMHQPDYREPNSGRFAMPWVRLHATKDYLDMPLRATAHETVRVTFNPRVAALEDLIAIHLATHSSASNHALRGKYRSAVYVVDPAQADRANAVLEAARRTLARPPVTRVLPLQAFRPSPERFQHYARRNAGKPFCRTYIDPKSNVLREEFPRLAADS